MRKKATVTDGRKQMEILIVSDSHGRKENITRLLARHPLAKYLLFLGDGIKDIEGVEKEFPHLIVCAVRGNCDFFSDAPEERCFMLEGVRILMMHGHTYGIKGGVGAALSYAKKKEADILLFGHTHMPREECVDVGDRYITLFNPGSLAERTKEGFSFGILEIRQGKYLLSHGTL